VVQKGEDAWALSRRLQVDASVLLHHLGQKRISEGPIQVPAYYGSRITLAVDQKTRLPARLEVFDGKGRLYEFYEWSQIDTRGDLSSADFDPKNPNYHY
jgi:hypothetical protein